MAAEPLNRAAAARHDRAVARAEEALRALDREYLMITFQAVARRAGVSRQWLYTQPALREQIQRLRDRAPTRADGVPTRQRASEASLRQRVEALRAENRRLREENASLKDERADRLRPAAHLHELKLTLARGERDRAAALGAGARFWRMARLTEEGRL